MARRVGIKKAINTSYLRCYGGLASPMCQTMKMPNTAGIWLPKFAERLDNQRYQPSLGENNMKLHTQMLPKCGWYPISPTTSSATRSQIPAVTNLNYDFCFFTANGIRNRVGSQTDKSSIFLPKDATNTASIRFIRGWRVHHIADTSRE